MKSTGCKIGLVVLALAMAPALWGADDDSDGIDSAADNCPLISNAGQADLDGDNLGDLCDEDIDGDGLVNAFEEEIFGTDPVNWDTDGDNVADFFDCFPLDENQAVSTSCDRILPVDAPIPPINPSLDPFGDEDGDGVVNEDDNCPFVLNPGQQDTDQDGVGDICDNQTQPSVPPTAESLNGEIDGAGGCSLVPAFRS